MSLPVHEIDRMLLELEQQFQRDKETLVRMKELALRHQVIPAATQPVRKQAEVGRIGPTRSGKKTDRQIIREFLAGWTGSFTIPDLISAAERAGNAEATQISQNVWSSTVFWLCKNGFVRAVKPREGNKPGTYQVAISREELVAPKRKALKRGFSAQQVVLAALKEFKDSRFGKKQLSEFVYEKFPEHKDRLSYDVLASTIHRLGKTGQGIRIVEHSREGNVYEKI